MRSRPGRGRWERVLAARRRARESLGGDSGDEPYGPPKRKSQLPAPTVPRLAALHPSERSELVLSLGEVAVRLGVGRAELEAMIAAGKIEALPTGYTLMIPTRAVEQWLRQ